MNSLYDSRQLLKYLFIVAAVVIAIASVFVSDLLIKDLARLNFYMEWIFWVSMST